jgi:hypothetical protein
MSATVLLNQASVMQTTNGNTSDIIWSGYTELAVDALVTNQQGTSPTLQLLLDRKDAANNYEPIWQSSVTSVSTASTTNVPISSSIGVGLSIGGSATPGATFNISLIAK